MRLALAKECIELKGVKSGRSLKRSGKITDTFNFQEWN
jgi:hypothetical protein